MNEMQMTIAAGAVGVVLGAVFFGGLWWTVRKGASSDRLILLFAGSMLLRMGIVLTGFYLISGGHWQRLLACLIGFLIARFLVIRLSNAPIEHLSPHAKEVGHAP